jgi:hypothetical protein
VLKHSDAGAEQYVVDLHDAERRPPGFAFAVAAQENIIVQCLVAVSDLARVSDGATTAEAYAIREIVYSEARPSPEHTAKLVNTGTVDPFKPLWGTKKCTYLGFKDNYPVVDRNKLGSISARRADQASRPKVIMAGMGSRLEAFVDPTVEYLCVKSAILVLPNSGVCPFALAVYLNAKCTSEYFRSLFSAQGFGANSMNVGPRQVAALPAPSREALKPASDEPPIANVDDAVEGAIAGEPVLSRVGRYLHGRDEDSAWPREDLDRVVTTVIEADLNSPCG